MNEIDSAIIGLSGIKDLISPLLARENKDRQGKQDVAEFERHLEFGED